jgi:hypothetical protein
VGAAVLEPEVAIGRAARQVFASENAGDSWVKLRREFAEIRTLAWTPN